MSASTDTQAARERGLEQLEAALLESVCERVRAEAPPDEAAVRERFVRRYFRWVAPEDLIERAPADLHGAALAHLRLAERRAPGEANVRAYNPDPDRDGWHSPHTAVEIVTDDMPFLVDSVGMALARSGYAVHLLVHPVIGVERDGDGRLRDACDPPAPGAAHEGAAPDGEGSTAQAESIMHLEVDREPDSARLAELTAELQRTLAHVRAAVEDWPSMRARLREAVAELAEPEAAEVDADELAEVRAFLDWVDRDRFVFVGYREYRLDPDEDGDALRPVDGSGLGVLRGGSGEQPSPSFAKLPAKAKALARDPYPLVLTRANRRSPIHRPIHLDYIGVKRFDESGRVTGERRFLGLYTSAAERESPRAVPILRGKVGEVLDRAGFIPGSHDAKALLDILESYPREELIQAGARDLFRISMGILALGERPRLRLFVRRDPYERLVSCLVFVPRDRFNTDSRERIAELLRAEFAATDLDWAVRTTESRLVRLHFVLRLAERAAPHDVADIEARLAEATRSWAEDLRSALIEAYGEERGAALERRYRDAFPPGYRADLPVSAAVSDIDRIERAGDADHVVLYRPDDDGDGHRVRLYTRRGAVPLSEVLPLFERMGISVDDERPYELDLGGDAPAVWIHDFGVDCQPTADDHVRERFEQAFLAVLHGELENDRLGALVLTAGLDGREVSVLRALSRYLRQAGSTFSDRYLQQALTANPGIARRLVELFQARFDPDGEDGERSERMAALERDLGEAIDAVESLDQDRILRRYLALIGAITRTSYYREADSLAFKLDPSAISFLPDPRPQFEIFVYSPRVEGVHLRGGRVARGGLRWSDRPEDFRTEILGLMKAQMVKNALIVPVGAKGGFVVKRPPADREKRLEEARACYRLFVGGLLDVTDNIDGDEIVPPPRTVRYDGDDTYLVVAADKGTATFSDLANEIAAGYGFWLGDGFASGGSNGYDHKQMGITARGCWESVKRHFLDLGSDALEDGFTAVGIGDMSGDVFGNGMLLSRGIRLVAAFNHEHIFIDPEPDPEASFDERKRLFALGPAGSWSAYDEGKLSPGGGIYPRSAKRIALGEQARRALDVDAEELTPNELIQAILRAPADLLWNGGIGTYVKSAGESHADVGDRAGDGVRVDAGELRCRVVGEGGNLGLTQRARIDYALAGGRINTDAIDNAGGVNCSDHEVNLKILLDAAVRDGALERDERDHLLADLEEAVAARVLSHSYVQALGLSLEQRQARALEPLHARLIRALEQETGLDRRLEVLPSDEQIGERRAAGQGLTSPELAVLHAFTKIAIYDALLASDLPEDEYLQTDMARSFPAPLPQRFARQMREHHLRREIVATTVANSIVDRVGTTFVFRLAEESGASVAELARAYAATIEVFQMRDYWEQVEALDRDVAADVQAQLLLEARRLVTRATRWFARNRGGGLDIAATTDEFGTAAGLLAGSLPEILVDGDRRHWEDRVEQLTAAGVPDDLARRAAGLGAVFAALDVVEISRRAEGTLEQMTATYFALGSRLELHWLRDRILELPRLDRWQTLARAALRDDLYALHRALTAEALSIGVDAWLDRTAGIERYLRLLAEVKARGEFDVTTLSVAVREAGDLGGAGARSSDARLL